ncbi:MULTISPECIES: undecaprenyldiphospho-muramoylpentapeptide beta-N-acetylglucosaminyltransferase [unclassified Limnobacter]|jgi:UDP-N-acetylglucosamine--N-acetylmuramyl-(pentapeptide) pyrophosphoryl-undecaprenol N-acetylglucosamine transferase|uniref:undecaprenyldiphospho-muramoylpentapeptide beta-N-acetylglucosaminyltransferase n=1 Tax=unclassified Limnobacter TaxID=2630203 RepID=UPI000C3D621F|nr:MULTISPECIES: undecaprenyldiphospho-muramoylpentapeptide beta-N-acetylglucosaminyltransferase [unclassified Limnobacter]MAZ09979.1 undecaprenyldiphospho-muramoylpentapeptide beta-N-acetylglucosaminyltransferase [Sutterellaceae bacterium]|tara:strand:- start:425 stop:1498 length:1074 start_codon:yes stop_codon:yes gene_type:complete
MSKAQRLALIVAGGTGGHIFPGLSVASELKARGWQVQWAGNPQAMEGRLVPANGVEMNTLVFSGFRGKGILQQVFMPLKLLRAFWTSVQILRRTRPAVVLGMGGYVAFPLGMMASLLNIPLVVHEQNSVAGLTNKVLAKLADRNLVAFPYALPNSNWVGNPVREMIYSQPEPRARFQGRSGPLKLLVLGGSLGAQALNEVVPKALAMLPADCRPEVVHQAGEKNLPALRDNYEKAGVSAQQLAFIDDVAAAMATADLVICRAGAMTVAEVAAIGVAALFVPFPHAVDDHQTHNAGFLVKENAAWLRQQHELDAAWLANWLQQTSRDTCLAQAERARALAKPQATQEVANYIEQVAKV